MCELKNWLSQTLMEDIENENLDKYRFDLPFLSGYIPNVFKSEALFDLKDFISSMDKSSFNLHDWGYYYQIFAHKQFVNFLLSRNFKIFLSQLSGKTINPFKDYPYPQLLHFKTSAKGLNIHNDFGSGREFATLMYMNESWKPNFGGELNLYKKTGSDFKCIRKVFPKVNSMFFFEVTPESYHAVAPMKQKWQRDTIVTDWQLKCG